MIKERLLPICRVRDCRLASWGGRACTLIGGRWLGRRGKPQQTRQAQMIPESRRERVPLVRNYCCGDSVHDAGMQYVSHGVRLYVKHERNLFRMDLHGSAHYSDEHDVIRSPYIIRSMFGPDTRVLKGILCIGRFWCATRLTRLPAHRVRIVFLCIHRCISTNSDA